QLLCRRVHAEKARSEERADRLAGQDALGVHVGLALTAHGTAGDGAVGAKIDDPVALRREHQSGPPGEIRSGQRQGVDRDLEALVANLSDVREPLLRESGLRVRQDRKSTRLNSSHVSISYAVFCLKK